MLEEQAREKNVAVLEEVEEWRRGRREEWQLWQGTTAKELEELEQKGFRLGVSRPDLAPYSHCYRSHVKPDSPRAGRLHCQVVGAH